jgi:hypothetical protein
LERQGSCPGILAPKPPRRSYRVRIKRKGDDTPRHYSFPTFEEALDAKLEYEATRYPADPTSTASLPRGIYLTKYHTYSVIRRGGDYVRTYKHKQDALRVADAIARHQPIPEDLIENRYPGLHYDPDRRHWVITHDGATVGTAPTFAVAKRIKQDLERR